MSWNEVKQLFGNGIVEGASQFLGCLEETFENSPGFQAWGNAFDLKTSSPEGTAEFARRHGLLKN
jgi:hypothetical protein